MSALSFHQAVSAVSFYLAVTAVSFYLAVTAISCYLALTAFLSGCESYTFFPSMTAQLYILI